MIRLVGVCKSYQDRVLLRDVSFTVEAGDIALLTGPSGSGKTTLLRLLHGAERPDRGDVFVADRRVQLLRHSALPHLRRALGFVFQDFKLLEGSTAYANVALALEVRGVGRREAWSRAMQALTAVGLADMATTRVEHLSGGEQQRVAIARAIVGEPAAVLADEPTGNLDEAQARVVLGLLAAQTARGTAVIVATHDPLVARAVAATRVFHLEHGVISEVQQRADSMLGIA